MRSRRVRRLLEESGLTPEEIARWTFESFKVEWAVTNGAGKKVLQGIVEDLRAYARGEMGGKPWRVLQGTYGCGKTHLAYAVAAERVKAWWPVYVANVAEMLATLRRGFDAGDYEDRLETLRRVDLLVLDDLGAESMTPFALEVLYRIVDFRYRQRLPLVVTTNALLTEESGGLPGRLVSRLLDVDISRAWVIPAKDYRRRGEVLADGRKKS